MQRMSPIHQITMLKFIKNLSMLATTLDALHNSNAIEVLTDLLSTSFGQPHFQEISNQALNIMFNLCRLSKTRQEDAALNGVVPLLIRIVKSDRPRKEFALPILCDMAHSGKVGRKILWQNKGLQFYITLLADPFWQVTALDAIFVWLQEETAKVEERLLDGSFSKAIVDCFASSKADFEKLLEPLQKLLRLSPLVASALAHSELFSRTAQKLHTKKAVVRLNLLRIIRSICDASEEQGSLIRKCGLQDAIVQLAHHDPAILVREMASELLKSSDNTSRRSTDGTGRLRPGGGARRASSASVSTPPSALSSAPPTPSSHPRSNPTYSDLDLDQQSTRPRQQTPLSNNGGPSSSSLRPPANTHDHTASTSTTYANGASPGFAASGFSSTQASSSRHGSAVKSRLPRTSSTRHARVSLIAGKIRERNENATPPSSTTLSSSPSERYGGEDRLGAIHAPPRTSSVLASRRRRQTSSVGVIGGRWS